MHYIAKEVQLPSRGKLYQGKLGELQGKILVYPVTLRTQKSLLVDNPRDFKLSILLDSCTNLKELGFDYKDLLVADEYFLFLVIRALTFGATVETFIQCVQCNNLSPVSINLDKIDVKTWDNMDITEPFTIILDNINISMRFLKVQDQDVLLNVFLNMKTPDVGQVFDTMLLSLAKRLVSVDGQPKTEQEAYEFFSNIPIPMITQIDQELENKACGPDIMYKFNCSKCNVEN
ncbi:MAG: hypothetical protein QW303_08645, partial [Nitrososphaerota archaeon]